MKTSFFDEPELEFGNGGTHIDIRYGLTEYGPLDIGEITAPTQLKVGLIGTEQSITELRSWFERCKEGIPAKETRLVNLFPAFPPFTPEGPLQAALLFHDRWSSPIRQREIDDLLTRTAGIDRIRKSVAIFIEHARGLVEAGGPMVLVCAPPLDLLDAVDEVPTRQLEAQDQDLDESSDPVPRVSDIRLTFHDLLKAEAMRLGVPIQMVRPHTYGGTAKSKVKKARKAPLQMQDEATRAWNMHTALYYKAGGVPWRLLRNSSDLSTCFVGISFYRSLDGDRLLTSVAQVFNERGEGVIVKGAQAQINKEDRQPHLSEDDARALLRNAISVYRKEHRTTPARLVIHKTSKVTAGEEYGFRNAADTHEIDLMEILSMKRSFTRLFREGTYPPLRGTFVSLQEDVGLLYLRGSVQFFETYPGMYVPRPLEFAVSESETSLDQLAKEILSLSKLNWNNTQFDGGEPITLRAARRVGDILKCVADDGVIQPSFRFFI